MSPSRPVFAVAVALLAVAPSPATAQSTAPKIELSAAGKRALKPLTLSTGTLTVTNASVTAAARVAVNGTLRFKAGKRSANATALSLTVGRTSSYVAARLGRKNLRLLAVKPTRPPQLDAARGAVSLAGARIALTPAAAKALRTALKLERTPSTKTLGTLSVAYAPTPIEGGSPLPAPAPGPSVPPAATATPTPSATATPTPETSTERPPCDAARFTAAPAGSVDWLSCDLPGTRDLFSWTRYVLTSNLPVCSTEASSIVASGGAARLLATHAFDHRFPVESVSPDGRTLQLRGTITYAKPSLGINEVIRDLRIVFAADGQSGEIFASGLSAPRQDTCGTPSDAYTGEKVMDFTATRSNGYVRLHATVAAGNQRLGGGQYEPGRPWGSFTFPER
ncbi:hypothetical protein DVA67_014675 [Solirubrobacter sp. CPCC 204708]|uniref:Htaa domain-containing protein n=1 Tax=Solirubrobacter deserti TaxID=2282478 RepID=A0ABT4RBH1_9ACTN|nr:hypothetical protein [Solirubrobacter deserti]MBE2317223.1 hypothetical protein [Solirubrobacter deserti]MDA0135884.1 hypothetical protein [Solirubrobacter deserti]